METESWQPGQLIERRYKSGYVENFVVINKITSHEATQLLLTLEGGDVEPSIVNDEIRSVLVQDIYPYRVLVEGQVELRWIEYGMWWSGI